MRRARHVVLLLFVAGWALYASTWLVPSLFHHFLPFRCMAELLMLVTYFFAGAVCFLYREKIAFSAAPLGVSAIALACALPNR